VTRQILLVWLIGLAAGHRGPTPTEVKDAVARAYGGVVTADTGRPPRFVTGDFNWDGSEDLAVLVTPVDGRLDAINSELANWVVEDPTRVRILDFLPRRVSIPAPTRITVNKGDTLLAVIHGAGPDGWRARQISHFYLVADAGVTRLQRQSKSAFYASIRNAPKQMRTVRGDVIAETRGSTRGFIVYAGGKYAWYSPETTK
jgi:hypothetical protein